MCAWPIFYEYRKTALQFHGFPVWLSTEPGHPPIIVRTYMSLEVFVVCQSHDDRARALAPAIRAFSVRSVVEQVARSL